MATIYKPPAERVLGMGAGPTDGDDTESYEAKVTTMIADARDFQLAYRTPKREMFMRYYMGEEPELDDEGRSTIVATEVRDTVLSIMPSLMRIFTAHEHVCEYVPTTVQMVEKSDEATNYINWVMMEDNEGFLILFSVFKDALTKGEGVTKWWTEEQPKTIARNYQGILPDQFQWLISQPGVEVVHQQVAQVMGPDGALIPAMDVRVRVTKTENVHCVEAVPPDEFLIDRHAVSVKKARLVGHERYVTESELVEMGFDPEDLEDEIGGGNVNASFGPERIMRNEGDNESGMAVDDDMILYGEFYIRIDQDGDGIAELRRICCVGENSLIVSDEEVEYSNFAFFNPDPEPHTAIGHSIAELVMDLQKIKTNLLRNSLDAIAQTIFPRIVAVENMVNMDDVMNTELGAPIRAKSIDAVSQLQNQFVGEAPLTMMGYLDSVRQSRTGISEASKGLDPKALQSTTMKGVDMVITGAQERIELIARILAETGMKDMFRGLLREVSDNPNYERTIKVNGKWTPIQPDYDPSMGVRVNPSLGRGSDMDRFMVLSQVLSKQELIMQTFGPDNPMVTPIQWRNTMQDLLSIGAIKNIDRYFGEMSPEQLQQMMQQKAQQAQNDPALILALNEKEKLRQSTVKSVADDNYRHEKLQTDDGFRRDKLEVDATLKGAAHAVANIAQNKDHAHEQDIAAQDRQQADTQHQREIAANHIEHLDNFGLNSGNALLEAHIKAMGKHADIAQGDRHKAVDAHMQRQALEDKVTTTRETNDARAADRAQQASQTASD